MGLMEKAKGVLGRGGESKSSSDEIAEDWIEDVDSEVSESDEEMEGAVADDVDPVEEEWDSAYRFAEEFLEVRGFASMVDFTNKCMAYKINQSPMYRDRISNGVDTMNRITTMRDQMKEIGGGGDDDTSYKEKAERLEGANEVIDQAEKLNGKEDAMVNELIGMGHELAESIADSGAIGGQGRDVNSDVNQRNEEL